MKYSHICDTCKKITKIYDNNIWLTEDNDFKCHTHFLTIKKHNILNIKILDSENLIKMLKICHSLDNNAFVYVVFEANSEGKKMYLKYLTGKNISVIEVPEHIITRFTCTKKKIYLELDVDDFIKGLRWTFMVEMSLSNEPCAKLHFLYS
jgi:hypothetical protein